MSFLLIKMSCRRIPLSLLFIFNAIFFSIGTPYCYASAGISTKSDDFLLIKTDYFSVDLQDGFFTSFTDLQTGNDYRPETVKAPLLAIRKGQNNYNPTSMKVECSGRQVSLVYEQAGVTAIVEIEAKPTHIVMEVVSITEHDSIELVQWGPYPTSIGGLIGESVGVVRDRQYAIGIQSLNPKTIGAEITEHDTVKYYRVNDDLDMYDFSSHFNSRSSSRQYRGTAAMHRIYGRSLRPQ